MRPGARFAAALSELARLASETTGGPIAKGLHEGAAALWVLVGDPTHIAQAHREVAALGDLPPRRPVHEVVRLEVAVDDVEPSTRRSGEADPLEAAIASLERAHEELERLYEQGEDEGEPDGGVAEELASLGARIEAARASGDEVLAKRLEIERDEKGRFKATGRSKAAEEARRRTKGALASSKAATIAEHHASAAEEHRAAAEQHRAASKASRKAEYREAHAKVAAEHEKVASEHDAKAAALREPPKPTKEGTQKAAEKLGKALHEHDGKAVREGVREQLAQHGLVSRDGSGKDHYEVNDEKTSAENSNAFHDWNGKIVMSGDAHQKAREAFDKLGRDPKYAEKLAKTYEDKYGKLGARSHMERELHGARVLFHEAIHGCSPGASTPAAYTAAGKGMEEAVTEISARKVTREAFRTPKALELPFHSVGSDGTSRYAGGRGSYNHYIRGLMTSVHEHTGGGPDVGKRVEDACLKMRGAGSRKYQRDDDQARHFADTIRGPNGSDLTRSQRDSLYRKLSDPDGPMSKEGSAKFAGVPKKKAS